MRELLVLSTLFITSSVALAETAMICKIDLATIYSTSCESEKPEVTFYLGSLSQDGSFNYSSSSETYSISKDLCISLLFSSDLSDASSYTIEDTFQVFVNEDKEVVGYSSQDNQNLFFFKK